jgi:hypothetical protein
MRFNTTTTIIREETDEEIEIEASYYAGRPATYLDPEEHPEVEILSAFIGGEEVELTEAEEEQAIEKILGNPPERDYDEE